MLPLLFRFHYAFFRLRFADVCFHFAYFIYFRLRRFSCRLIIFFFFLRFFFAAGH